MIQLSVPFGLANLVEAVKGIKLQDMYLLVVDDNKVNSGICDEKKANV